MLANDYNGYLQKEPLRTDYMHFMTPVVECISPSLWHVVY